MTIKCIFVKIKSTKNTVLFPPLGKQLCFYIEERPKFVVVKLYYHDYNICINFFTQAIMCSKRHYTYALVFDSGKTDRVPGKDSFRAAWGIMLQ